MCVGMSHGDLSVKIPQREEHSSLSSEVGTLMQHQNQESDRALGSNDGPLKAWYLFFCPGMYVRS